MGFRYRKSIRLGGGFRINISGSGVGYSWGVPGYRITKTANGKIRQTTSIPGTGLSYSTEESIYKSARKSALKEEPYTDTEVIQSTDRADYKNSDFKALMKRINRVCFLNKASLIVGAIGLLAFIVLHTPQRLFLTILSFIVFLYPAHPDMLQKLRPAASSRCAPESFAPSYETSLSPSSSPTIAFHTLSV